MSEQSYYKFLVRTDHPVFKRDYAEEQSSDSPFNSILNRVLAKQMVKMRTALDIVKNNTFPHLVTIEGIDEWENRFFSFTKSNLDIADRVEQLVFRYNNRVGLTEDDVQKIAFSFTGRLPRVIINSYFGGWVLGEAALDIDTVFSGEDTPADRQTYFVIFDVPIPSDILNKLDNELTNIEKAGSKHYISSPTSYWSIGESSLNHDTILGN